MTFVRKLRSLLLCSLLASAYAVQAASLSQSSRLPDLPPNAVKYLPLMLEEQVRLWPEMQMPSALAGQIEQETCISLKHKRCWSPYAELRTNLERGVGLGQITKTARFDSLAEMRKQNVAELSGWKWENDSVYDPRLQLRGLILMNKRNFRAIVGAKDYFNQDVMSKVAYNGGLGGLNSDRRICAATKGCNPSVWFGNVEHTSLKSKKLVPGYGKPFFYINREYPKNIYYSRRQKYVPYLGS